MNTENKSKNFTYIAIGLFTVAIGGLGIIVYSNLQTNSSNNNLNTAADNYKDGAYNSSGSYRTPAGTEEISISLVLKNGAVESLTVVNKAKDQESKEYQEKFIRGINAVVVGKKIEEISVSRVSGSSLTGAGFNEALRKIKDEAGK